MINEYTESDFISIFELVDKLWCLGVSVSVKDGSLVIEGNTTKLSSHDLSLLKKYKVFFLNYLNNQLSSSIEIPLAPLTSLQEQYVIGGKLFNQDLWINSFGVVNFDRPLFEKSLIEAINTYEFVRSYVYKDRFLKVGQKLNSIKNYYTFREINALSSDFRNYSELDKKELFLEDRVITSNNYHILVCKFEDCYEIIVSGSLIIGDAFSWNSFTNCLSDIMTYGLNREKKSPLSVTENLVRTHLKKISTRALKEKSYWGQVEHFNPPVLLESNSTNTIKRKVALFDSIETEKIKSISVCCGVTIDQYILSLFAIAISRWSETDQFSINLLIGKSDPTNVSYGNSSGVIPISFDFSECPNNSELLDNVKINYLNGIGNSFIDYSSRATNFEKIQSAKPKIAYSSGFGLDVKNNELIGLTRLGYEELNGVVRSPGISIDLQAFYYRNGIRLNFDYNTGLVSESTAESILENISDFLKSEDFESLLSAETKLPNNEIEIIKVANESDFDQVNLELSELIERSLSNYNGIFYSDNELSLSFKDVHSISSKIYGFLSKQSINKSSPIAILCKERYVEIASMLAILNLGAFYTPFSLQWPKDRIKSIIEASAIEQVLVDGVDDISYLEDMAINIHRLDTLSSTEESNHSQCTDNIYNSHAYVMYTSGTTGVPKGVAITQASMLNTIQSINNKYSIGPGDSILGISKTTFDLSVYDIFGMLVSGGRYVDCSFGKLPVAKDISSKLILENITIWNSVPALIELVTEFAEIQTITYPRVRLILMSGDWIPTTLPKRLSKIFPNAEQISLGGATECSIWSNYFHIPPNFDETHESVPYGFPLSNQKLLVLDKYLRDRPIGTIGDLYITGRGVGTEYWNAPELTASSFIALENGERAYRTGDKAYRNKSGAIIFKGREDGQIKISGHRVEISEITNAISNISGINNVEVIAIGSGRNKHLVGIYSPNVITDILVRRELENKLPHYMIPTLIVGVDKMPLTANGKVDRAGLQKLSEGLGGAQDDITEEIELEVIGLWEQALSQRITPGNHEFYSIGGSSMNLAKLALLIENKYEIDIDLVEVMSATTVKAMSDYIRLSVEQKKDQQRADVYTLRKGSKENSVLVLSPVGGTILGYLELAKTLPKDVTVYGLQTMGMSLDERTIESVSECYLQSILDNSLNIDCVIGWSFGALTAMSLQEKLQKKGIEPSFVYIDPWVSSKEATLKSDLCLTSIFIKDVLLSQSNIDLEKLDFKSLNSEESYSLYSEICQKNKLVKVSLDEFMDMKYQFEENTKAILKFRAPKGVRGILCIANQCNRESFYHLEQYSSATSKLKLHSFNEDHYSIMSGDSIKEISDLVLSEIDEKKMDSRDVC